MKKYLLPVALILCLGASFAFKGGDVHLKGYIEDSLCAESKTQMSPLNSRVACVKKCIKSGASAVLVADGKIYKIANQKAVLKYAGENVSVEGTLSGDTIQVTNITENKL